MAEPGKLSSTKILVYTGCSMAYFLNYIEHKKVPQNFRLVFGKTTHYMLDRFYKVNYKSADSFAGYWKFYWSGTVAGDFLKGKDKERLKIEEYDFWRKDEQGKRVESKLSIGDHVNFNPNPVGIFFGYMKLGENILRRFYNRHKGKTPPICTERNFGVRKDEPIEINGHLIRGVFDRIDEKDGTMFIADYKTDKHSPEYDPFILHRSSQFTLYSYAFRRLFEKKEEAILYYHLRSGDIFKTYRGEKDYDYLKRVLDEVANGILKDKFIPNYDWHCGFCDYKDLCDEYCIDYHGGPRIDLGRKIICAEKFTDWDAEVPTWIESIVDER